MPRKKNKKPKKKAKVVKLPEFSEEELSQEVDTFLTTKDPYKSESSVEFDQKTYAFKVIFDYKKPVLFYRIKGSVKRRIVGSYGLKYEEALIKIDPTMKTKFNFRNKDVQTTSFKPQDKSDYIDPNLSPVLRFNANATKDEITTAYERHEAIKKEEDSLWRNLDLSKILRYSTKTELKLVEKNVRYLRLCERMLDQNKSEANLDLTFYDDPNDDFKPNAGYLLPLWHLTGKEAAGMSVTSFSWNKTYKDMFAVGFGRTKPDQDDDKDENNLRVMRDHGIVCVFSLKCTSYPQRLFRCGSGVCSVQFHPSLPHLLLAAFYSGGVAIYDMRTSTALHRGKDSKFFDCYHCDRVTGVRWLSDTLPQKFCSVSHDGKILTWLYLVNDLFPADTIFDIRLKNSPIDPPPKGLEMVLDPKADVGESLELNTSPTAISINPSNEDLILIGTAAGLLHQFSVNDKRCIRNYEEHSGDIYSVHWNSLHPKVFITCSKDYTVQIWDQDIKPIFEFFIENEVLDVAWAPFSSTLFAIISGNAVVSIFDLALNKKEAIGSYTVYSWKEETRLTKVAFHPTKPIILVGDDSGSIVVFKLSPNLRSSLKVIDTMEHSKYVIGEIEKLDKILASAKVHDKFS